VLEVYNYMEGRLHIEEEDLIAKRSVALKA
jgi:hypothetical protein